jgi:para-nitrobenzyl esterase
MKAVQFAVAASLFLAAAHASVVAVEGGRIRGQDLADGSAVYRAIPYAAPPVGDLRWKPPAPLVPWKGVRDAVNAPHPCMQLNETWNAAAAAFGSEDCLYLSLHVPAHKAGARLPVFVWIHGGSNRAGSGFGVTDSPIYARGLIMVGVEYRLGVFGFLGSPELTAESPHHASGNYALMDQIAALKWVKANIAKFGGDPNNVTIGGQSAGAVDVGQLLRSPLARGLFAKAIQESGAPGLARSAAMNEGIGSDLLAALKLPAGARGLAALRALPAQTVLEQAAKLKSPQFDDDSIWIATTADGWVLPGTANNLWINGEQAPVPLLIGDNTREFVVDIPDGGRALIRATFGPNADRALALYGFKGDATPPSDPILGNTATQALTDIAFRCSTNRETLWQVQAGAPVWRYQFGLPRPGSKMVEHTAELDYVFGAAPKGATRQSWPPLQQYWANFVKSGDPNGPGLAAWPQMGTQLNYLAFLPDGAKTGQDLRGDICRLMAETFGNR